MSGNNSSDGNKTKTETNNIILEIDFHQAIFDSK
jgi:hypothetical protein